MLYNILEILDDICVVIIPPFLGIVVYEWVLIKKFDRISHLIQMRRWLSNYHFTVGVIILLLISAAYGKEAYLEWSQGTLEPLGHNVLMFVESTTSWIVLILFRRMLSKKNVPNI